MPNSYPTITARELSADDAYMLRMLTTWKVAQTRQAIEACVNSTATLFGVNPLAYMEIDPDKAPARVRACLALLAQMDTINDLVDDIGNIVTNIVADYSEDETA